MNTETTISRLTYTEYFLLHIVCNFFYKDPKLCSIITEINTLPYSTQQNFKRLFSINLQMLIMCLTTDCEFTIYSLSNEILSRISL